MTESVGFAPEPESGNEIQFCPIRQLPIVRNQRVRTLPGFHLLSLSAGREALAVGYYQAFGQRFVCTDLEYLHVDDKVFVCAEDHKAFLNQMSMQYHRYIRYELEERKAERKRMKERAAERQARSAAHAAQLQQKKEQVQQKAQLRQKENQAAADPRSPAPAAKPGVSGTPSTSAAEQTSQLAVDDPYAAVPVAMDDPYAAPEDPYQDGATEASTAAQKAGAASKVPGGLGQAGSGSRPAATEASATSVPAATPVAASVAAGPAPANLAAKSASPPPRKEAPEDDLYGDVADREVKKPRTASTYATAIGAMMTDDFDEDE
mmetsp:Transcript_80066/g.138971  ORF Transcript_80066/g.138971 Transcript_80066/m.138971 type:complete len:320 (-) Transcript_80066:51-1010(-)